MRRFVQPVLAAALVSAVLVTMLGAGVFAAFRAQAVDALFPLGEAAEQIAVVGIDQRSIDKSGQQWPWPRSLQAQLVDAIHAAEPKLIVLDVVYSPARPDDAALATALQGHPVVTAALAAISRGERLFEATELTGPVPAIGPEVLAGHSAITPDPLDGVTRSVPLVIETAAGEFVPSLSLVALSQIEGVSSVPTLRPHGVQVGGRYIPTDRAARLRVAYADGLSGGSARVISAAEVLAGETNKAALAGKIVFVGVTDPSVGDAHTTPTDKGAGSPGVLIHANALSTMLTRNYIATASTSETAVWIVALAALVAFTTWRLRVLAGAAVAAALLVVYFLAGFVRFDAGTEMDFVFPPLAVALSYAAALGVRIVTEAQERRRVAGLLEQYVPTPIAKHLLARGKAAGLPPTGTLTFLFTDVVGSTEAWEQYPRDMSEAMKTHDEIVETAVERSGGAVVRPRGEGDSRFCVFIAAIDAINAARVIDDKLRREQWKTPEPLQVRMGIHTGEAELRAADYYGSSVNRCARIRGVANAGEIVMSSVTAALVADDVPADGLRDRGLHSLKGMEEQEHVYELVTASSPSPLG